MHTTEPARVIDRPIAVWVVQVLYMAYRWMTGQEVAPTVLVRMAVYSSHCSQYESHVSIDSCGNVHSIVKMENTAMRLSSSASFVSSFPP